MVLRVGVFHDFTDHFSAASRRPHQNAVGSLEESFTIGTDVLQEP